MTETYGDLICMLKERLSTRMIGEVEYVEKRIPDSDEEGILDPRVVQLKREEEKAGKGPGAFSALSALSPEEFPVDLIRSKMGYPNLDLSTNIRTEHRMIDGHHGEIPIRIYSPIEGDQLPAVVYFHGGGFFGGSLDAVENPCKALAEKAGAVVISVGYRLAPEHPFPAGATDCYDAVHWVHQHASALRVHPDQVAVAGDSAGGNLATVCALADKMGRKGMIKYQALIYPKVNLADDFPWSLDEYTINNHHDLIMPLLEGLRGMGGIVNALYLKGGTAPENPLVSPLLSEDLQGMPKTLIITAEYDYLRLEGEAYARKLGEAGVESKVIRYNGMDHAFIDKFGVYPQAEDCIDEIAKDIRKLKS